MTYAVGLISRGVMRHKKRAITTEQTLHAGVSSRCVKTEDGLQVANHVQAGGMCVELAWVCHFRRKLRI